MIMNKSEWGGVQNCGKTDFLMKLMKISGNNMHREEWKGVPISVPVR